MSSASTGTGKIEVRIKWDPSPVGAPPIDLDIIAGAYFANAPYGDPAYLVYDDNRSPDGTIWLNRDSATGKGVGFDEVMTFELARLSTSYSRVVVGVAIKQRHRRVVFGDVKGTGFQIVEGHAKLAEGGFSEAAGATATTVAEFVRNASGLWEFHPLARGLDLEPDAFARTMGTAPS